MNKTTSKPYLFNAYVLLTSQSPSQNNIGGYDLSVMYPKTLIYHTISLGGLQIHLQFNRKPLNFDYFRKFRGKWPLHFELELSPSSI